MLDLEEVKMRILQGEEIENVLKDVNWKEFEEFVKKILENHGFETFHNFRFKTRRRYEIDVFGIKRNLALIIDCKKWRRGRYKKFGLKQAAYSQKERVKELKKFLKQNPIAQTNFKLNKRTKFFPLIITWYEEELLQHNNVLIVPVWKFNEFLLKISEYI